MIKILKEFNVVKKHRVSMLEDEVADAMIMERKLKQSVMETADFS